MASGDALGLVTLIWCERETHCCAYHLKQGQIEGTPRIPVLQAEPRVQLAQHTSSSSRAGLPASHWPSLPSPWAPA